MPYKDPAARKAANRARYLRRRDDPEFKAGRAAYRAANKDRQRELMAAWYAAHRDARRSALADAYRRNPEPAKERAKRYGEARRADPAFKAQRHARAARWRARRKGAPTVERVDRRVVFERDNWICQLCGALTDPEGGWGVRPSVDHIVALSRGGAHTYANVQTAHRLCNNRKWAH